MKANNVLVELVEDAMKQAPCPPVGMMSNGLRGDEEIVVRKACVLWGRLSHLAGGCGTSSVIRS